MTPDEKRALVTARLADRLREVLFGSEETKDWTDMATRVMNGSPAEQVGSTIVRSHQPGLWEVMAPLIQSLEVRAILENKLERYQGMPLTETVVRDILEDIDRVMDTISGVVENRRPVSRSFSNSAVWGGRMASGAGGAVRAGGGEDDE
jgi:hypothetical protein